MTTNRRLDVTSHRLAAALIGSLALAGCGSSPTEIGTSTDPTSASAFRFPRCMRANGALNFPDHPITPGSGINPLSPTYVRAQKACKKYLPPSGPPPSVPRGVRQQELALSICMRAHGVPNFPDPDANGDIQFPIGSPIPRSPAFEAAQNGPCRNYVGR
jgi:hypothetical protein